MTLRSALRAVTILAGLAALPAAAQTPPKSVVQRIDPAATGTSAPVEMQDGTGQWVPLGVVNPTTHVYMPAGLASEISRALAAESANAASAAQALGVAQAAVPTDPATGRPIEQQGPQPNATVAVGGLSGFEGFANPAATVNLRATGKVTPYLHYSAVAASNPGYPLGAIASVFGPQPSLLEVSLGGGFTPGFWTSSGYNSAIIGNGFQPGIAIVNLDNSATPFASQWNDLPDWQAFVNAGRAAPNGPKLFAPVVTPNENPTAAIAHPWSDTTYWGPVQQAALYGGGIAFDVPAGFWITGLPAAQQPAYQQWVEAALAWANANGIWSTVLVSPYFDAGQTLQNAQLLYQNIADAGALPSMWVSLNYDPCSPAGETSPPWPTCVQGKDPAYNAGLGTDGQPEMGAGIGLWFAQHALTSRYTGPYSSVVGALPQKTFPTEVNGRQGNVPLFASDIAGLGTMAPQPASGVRVTGGTLDGVAIGGSVPGQGSFTNLTATGTVTLDLLGALGNSPGLIPGAGLGGLISFNRSGSRGEMNIWNTFPSYGGWEFDQLTGSGAYNAVLSIDPAGNTSARTFNASTAFQIGGAPVLSSSPSNYNLYAGNNVATNATGQYNTGVGVNALTSATSGSGDTALGVGALQQVTTGGNNVAVGGNAGQGLTTGTNNTLVGTNTNGLPAGLTNSTGIGYGASPTQSNQVVIGNSGVTQTTLQGTVSLGTAAKLPVYTVASLPACNSSAAGTLTAVSDATSPTYGGALTGGGSVGTPVYCNGSAWSSH